MGVRHVGTTCGAILALGKLFTNIYRSASDAYFWRSIANKNLSNHFTREYLLQQVHGFNFNLGTGLMSLIQI